MLPWSVARRRVNLAQELAKIRERGSWSENGGRQWSCPPFLPRRSCWRCCVLVLALVVVVGCASARVAYEYVTAAKLVHAEKVIREMAVEEGWSDERLEILLANLHRKYREE